MFEDQINLTSRAVDGIERALDQDFCRAESPERMAWVALQLRYVEDTEDFFPMGKWATIQSIESQLEKAAKYYAARSGK